MARKKIRGRIIRILDRSTVIINLGRGEHIADDSIFNILGEPEAVIDPFTEEMLGHVSVVKSKLKASQVYERFTIATTKWTTAHFTLPASMTEAFSGFVQTTVVDEGELLVDPKDVQPWKAKSETPVRVGDYVEVEVSIPEADVHKPQDEPSETEETQAEEESAEHAA